MAVDAGSLEDLEKAGYLTTKVAATPVCVFLSEGRAYALDDRCPHLGFPLHRGTVESGLVTCHWHHARFDLCSGATLDPFADDARTYRVDIEDGRVLVDATPRPFDMAAALRRIDEGLEQGLTLVLAKAVLALEAAGADPGVAIGAGARFATRFREEGFGPGLTVLAAMAGVLPHLAADDRPLALVHALSFLSGDTRGHSPRFALGPLGQAGVAPERLAAWYRRFIDTRSPDAAERTLATAIAGGATEGALCEMMATAATDHVFLDEGHVVDFTNKAFELVGRLSSVEPHAAASVLPTLVPGTARATRQEEESPWRHPHDLAALVHGATARLQALTDSGTWEVEGGRAARALEERGGTGALAWSLLGEDPVSVVDALFSAIDEGASLEQLARGVALAAALRVVRFHVQNDHSDWNVVHHGFTSANAVHQLVVRSPSPLLARGVVHGALKVFMDRFLKVPAARLPGAEAVPGDPVGALDEEALHACFDAEGFVDRAGAIVYRTVVGADESARAHMIAFLGGALLREDAGFHWFQIYEAAVRQALAWPAGSVEGGLILAAAARFLAAHTPTRRELSQVVRVARRLGRGEALYAEQGVAADGADQD